LRSVTVLDDCVSMLLDDCRLDEEELDESHVELLGPARVMAQRLLWLRCDSVVNRFSAYKAVTSSHSQCFDQTCGLDSD
jgi:hypothetical protein